MILRAEAPAKINRELRVGGRRGDGFHEIRSRIVSVDLTDVIEVGPATGSLEFSCSGEGAPNDDRNLVVQAARRLAGRLGVRPHARIRLEKRIPSGAGLGGGSSDAAVALLLLSRLWSSSLSDDELLGIAAEMGSDVPYFLVGGEAEVSGRGERVKPLEDSSTAELLLVIPPFPLSTAEVYAAYDRLYPAGRPLPGRLEIETSVSFFGPNDLASPVLENKDGMKTILDSAREAAPEFAITGSGSAVVLRGAGVGSARSLLERNPGTRLIACRTLTREEHRRRIGTTGGF